jgi:hypothetical protein
VIDWTAVGALATAVAVIVALAALVLDRLDRTSDEKRKQATRVTAWLTDWGDFMTGTPSSAVLSNASGVPVFRVVVWMVLMQGAGAQSGEEAARDRADWLRPTVIGVLPPGRYAADLTPFDPGMHRRPYVEIAFTDAAGRHWIRRSTGRLEEISKGAPEHYGIDQPIDWTDARPI